MRKSIHRILFGMLVLFLVQECGVLLGEDAVLKLYVTRHAQRGARANWPEADRGKNVCGDLIDGKVSVPREDSITPLGEKQCVLLGQYLKKLGFNGKVFASPCYRTMQTAVCTVKAIGPSIRIIPEPGLQGGGNRKAPAKGMSVAELVKRFPGMVQEVELPEFWKIANETTAEQRNARMEKFLDDLLKKEPAGQILLVGHSSTLPSLIIAINKRMTDKRLVIPHYPAYVVNCCLYVYHFNRNGEVVDASLENYNYLPEDMITNNFSPLKKLPPPAKKTVRPAQ